MYKNHYKQYYDKSKKLDSNIQLIANTINNFNKIDQNIQIIATTISNFIETSTDLNKEISVLNIVIDDLKDQIQYCQYNDHTTKPTNGVNLITKTIEQDSGIKLVYLQYLLLYDINLTNGIFMDIYLQEAQQILDENGGKLKHIK